jgi:hypothetical protein
MPVTKEKKVEVLLEMLIRFSQILLLCPHYGFVCDMPNNKNNALRGKMNDRCQFG